MKIILFSHPSFMMSQSMPRFAGNLSNSLIAAGHQVQNWSPSPRVYKLFAGTKLAKWAGYVDQYCIFPLLARRRLKLVPVDTLFVFCDQALGPWIPLVGGRPHVVHVHDLLALRSALGDLAEHPTSLTGRVYQRYIRHGFRHARHFISVSAKTKEDLHKYGQVNAISSEVVYNGLNYPYKAMTVEAALDRLRVAGVPDACDGMLLHVGGNQWYKNLLGVIAIYVQYCTREARPAPLLCVSPQPDEAAKSMLRNVPRNGAVTFVKDIDNVSLQAAYSLAGALLFPSLYEGFGWPLIEAQACGCPVITTNEPPMNEVAGPSAIYLPRLKLGEDINSWAAHGAKELINLLREPVEQRTNRRQHGLAWAGRFDSDNAIAGYMAIYQRIIREFCP